MKTIEPIWFQQLLTALVFPTSSSSGRTENNKQFHPNGMRFSDIRAWGIQIGPIATSWTHFVPQTQSFSWTFKLELPFHINIENGKIMPSCRPKMSLNTVIS